MRQRLVDTVEICYREAGEVVFEPAQGGERVCASDEKFTCKRCGKEFADPEPTLFSFNSPAGRLPRCQGFGNTIDYDMDLVIPNRSLSLQEGAVDPGPSRSIPGIWPISISAAKGKVRFNVPVFELREAERAILYDAHPPLLPGSRDQEIQGARARVHQPLSRLHAVPGLRRLAARAGGSVGARRREESGGSGAPEHRAGADFFNSMELSPEEAAIAEKVLVEIRQRLKFLNDVGLEYLTLDRLSMTLSGGEAQRIQLATCLGSRLVGACYVLDEPSIGLHSRDTGRLIRILEELRDLGNTILVVEHDPDVMRAPITSSTWARRGRKRRAHRLRRAVLQAARRWKQSR